MEGLNTLGGASEISAETKGTGPAGQIVVNAADLMIKGWKITTSTDGIDVGKAGNAGSITLDVSAIALDSGSVISSESTNHSTGNAGSISITSNSLMISGGSSVTTVTETPGTGGDISIGSGSVVLDQGGKIDASTQAVIRSYAAAVKA